MKWIVLIITVFTMSFSFVENAQSQSLSNLQIQSSTGFDKEISALMNDLNLNGEQKLVLGILMLKHSAEFDYKKFEASSKTKKYSMAKKAIKSLEKDLKGVLDKSQFKVYKKHKKTLRKALVKSA